METETMMTTPDEQDDTFGFEPLSLGTLALGIAIGVAGNLATEALKEAGFGKGLDPIGTYEKSQAGKGRPS